MKFAQLKISQREMMLGVATLAFVLLGGTWYAVNGKVEKWNAKKIEIAQLKEQIARHKVAIRMQSEWKGQLDTLETGLRVFDVNQRSVPSQLMRTITSISSKYGLDITKSNPYSEEPTGDLFELGINCTWTGKLNALIDFLAELQQQGIRYNIRTLNIQPNGKSSGQLRGNMVIDCAYTRRATAASNDAKQ